MNQQTNRRQSSLQQGINNKQPNVRNVKDSQYRIVIRDESCDNLIKQTIEFLNVVKDLKRENGLNIQVFMDDVREACCICGDQVTWGYTDIVKLLLDKSSTQGQSITNRQSTKPLLLKQKSPYAPGDVMNDTYTEVNPSHEQLQNFQMRVMMEGDHDQNDQLDSPQRPNKKQPLQNKNTNNRPSQVKETFNVNNKLPNNNQQQNNQFKTKINKPEVVPTSQVSIDDEYHSRFLDELKSGGD